MKPLCGMRVVELHSSEDSLALRLAIGFAGRVLADLGAEVMFEEAAGGDTLRHAPPLVGGVGALYAFLGAGKTACGDVAAALAGAEAAILASAGRDRFARLPTAHALLSLAGEDVAVGSEFTVMALSGVLDIIGDPAREPLRLAGHQAAYSAGLAAFTGLLAARAAGGGAVRVSLLETMLWINWKSAVAGLEADGVPHRRGDAAEWQAIRCADGWLALVYQPEDWPALCRFVDDPRLDAPHFATPALRLKHGKALAAIIEAALMCYTRAEIRAEAQARRLPLGPVWSLAELLEDPHYQARGVFHPAVLPDGSTAPMASLPLTWDGARLAPGKVPA